MMMTTQSTTNKLYYKDVLIVRYNPIDVNHQEKILALRK